MTKLRSTSITGWVLIALGLAYAALPKTWVEDRLGFEPDGGSGALEFAFVAIPLIVGAALIIGSLRRQSASVTPAAEEA